jgi:hypothetical protein
MKRTHVRRFSALVLAALWAGAWACSSDDELTPVGLARPCSLNSDCRTPLVCVFRLCHAQCEEDRDCGGEQRCVAGYDGNVCQLDSEIACDADNSCPARQVCGRDGECRDLCQKDADCTDGQLCANSGECASSDPTKDKVDAAGNIQVDPFGSGGNPSLGGQGGESGEGGGDSGGRGGTGGTGGTAGAAGGGMAGKGGSAGGGGTFGGTVDGPLSTEDCPAPSGEPVVHASEVVSEASTWGGVHRISGALRVDAPLVLEPCSLIGFDAGASVTVRTGGSIRALGTSGHAVTLTSSKPSPAAGDWANIVIQDGAINDSLFQHTIVAYGGVDTLKVSPGAVAGFSHVFVHDTTGTAIVVGLDATLTSFENVAVERAGDYPVKVPPLGVAQIDSITSTDSAHDEIGVVIDGMLERATTWKKHDLPYRVLPGSYSTFRLRARLDIEAGTELRMETLVEVQADGSLVAQGASNEPVTFTSARSSAMAGDWPGIVFQAESSSDSLLEHTIVEYAGAKAISVQNGATVSLLDSTIRAPLGLGVVFDAGAVISGFENVTVEDAGDSAFQVASDQATLLGSLTSTGSARDEIRVWQNAITTPSTWKNHGIPYRVVSGSTNTAPIQAELVIEAGVTILMDMSQAWAVNTGGSLKAMGTMEEPIVIKSSAPSPGMGAWGRITFLQSASTDSSFTWTTISDGSAGVLTITDNQVTATDLTFSNNLTCDVDLNGTGALMDGGAGVYTTCL